MSNLDSLFEYLDEVNFSNSIEYMVDKLYSKPIEYDIYTIEMDKHVFGGAVKFPIMGYKKIGRASCRERV